MENSSTTQHGQPPPETTSSVTSSQPGGVALPAPITDWFARSGTTYRRHHEPAHARYPTPPGSPQRSNNGPSIAAGTSTSQTTTEVAEGHPPTYQHSGEGPPDYSPPPIPSLAVSESSRMPVSPVQRGGLRRQNEDTRRSMRRQRAAEIAGSENIEMEPSLNVGNRRRPPSSPPITRSGACLGCIHGCCLSLLPTSSCGLAASWAVAVMLLIAFVFMMAKLAEAFQTGLTKR